jgi:hypothetical protein
LVPTAEEDFDISLFGYIDERPPEKVSGVGITLDQKKVHPAFSLSLSLSRVGILVHSSSRSTNMLHRMVHQVPFFVSWFEMAASGLDMLETFLKVRPTRHHRIACAFRALVLDFADGVGGWGVTDDGSGVLLRRRNGRRGERYRGCLKTSTSRRGSSTPGRTTLARR